MPHLTGSVGAKVRGAVFYRSLHPLGGGAVALLNDLLTFIGAGLVLRYGGHIGIENLQERFPKHARSLRLVIFGVMMLFFVVMLVVGIRYSRFTWGQSTPVMEIPVGAVYLAMPIGFALLIVHGLIMMRGYINEKAVLADADFDADAAASV